MRDLSKRSAADEEKIYTHFLKALGVRMARDPFPITAPDEVDYWADSRKVLSELIRAEGDALIFPSSRIHVFYGPLGGGKSFAVSYLAHPGTRKVLMKHLPSADKSRDFLSFSVAATYPPKAGMLTRTVYVGIFRCLFEKIISDPSAIAEFRAAANNVRGVLGEALRNAGASATRTLTGEINLPAIEKSQGYKLLTLDRSRLGSLVSLDDYVDAIKSLADFLLGRYERILISIDELENLRGVSGSERLFFNDFLRRLHEKIDLGLTIILIFSLQSFEDVQALLQPAVLSRISEKINFDFVRNRRDITDYIEECLQKGGGVNPSDVIEPEAVEAFAEDLLRPGVDITFRDVNKELHRIFSLAVARRKGGKPIKITKLTYQDIKKGVPVDQIIRDLRSEH